MALDGGVDVGAHRVEVEGEVGQVDGAVVGTDRAQRVGGRPAVAPVRVGRGRPGVTVFLDVGFEVGERAVVALDRQHELLQVQARHAGEVGFERGELAVDLGRHAEVEMDVAVRASHRVLAVTQRVQRAGPQAW